MSLRGGHSRPALGTDILQLLEELIPGTLALHMRPLLEELFAEPLENSRHPLHSLGRFAPSCTPTILRDIAQHKHSGALVVIGGDAQKVLLCDEGNIIAAKSTVVIEQVGRFAYREELLSKEEAEALYGVEQHMGLTHALQHLGENAGWLSERMVWAIGCSLYFMGRGYWVFLDETPAKDSLPDVCVDAVRLSIEGLRQYDEWRRGDPRAIA
jgi:hypothetical protein